MLRTIATCVQSTFPIRAIADSCIPVCIYLRSIWLRYYHNCSTTLACPTNTPYSTVAHRLTSSALIDCHCLSLPLCTVVKLSTPYICIHGSFPWSSRGEPTTSISSTAPPGIVLRTRPYRSSVSVHPVHPSIRCRRGTGGVSDGSAY